MTIDGQSEAFRRIAERGFGRGELAVLDELVYPGLVQHERGVSDSNGLDAVKQRLQLLHAGFPDLSATVEDTFGSADRVCARVRWSGTRSGEFAGIPATGRTAT